MASLANRRSIMTLFSNADCIHSHRVRIVLAEKGINHEVIEVTADSMPEDLSELNPYCSTPTLIDRDLVLYSSQVIMEYLDERFPHPPLMPVDPVQRAQSRLMLYRIERDWYSLVDEINTKGEKAIAKARKELRESLIVVAPLFKEMSHFMSEEFSLMDCALIPLLWRMPKYRIDLPEQAQPLLDYAERMFKRESFQMSLSEAEREMRAA
ncbi:MAG: glutathione S-transferase N-terminal domain-containing protein [Pseudomonadota bacterium]